MTDHRKDWDQRLAEGGAVEKIAGDLGLKGGGRHFFCPGCQPTGRGEPEMVIKGGQFQCFRCNAEGDVVGLVKLARGCDLESAISWLERETGAGPH